MDNKWSVITAAVSFGKQNPSTTSPQEVWRVLVSLHHAVRIARENHMWTIEQSLLHKGHKGKRQMQTENNGENYDRMDNKWSQQQSALVSRIKYNFATRSLTGPCFSASCCQNCEGESHVNNCEQMWTVFVAWGSQGQTANANRKQRRKLRQNGQQVITAAVSFGKQNQVQLRHKKSEGSLFLCIMLSELRGKITCEQLWTDVNRLCCKGSQGQTANANRKQRRKLRQNQQQVITAAVSFGKQNPSTTSPQEVWRVLVSLHHAVKIARENHMWTIMNRCEQSLLHKGHKGKRQMQTENNGENYDRMDNKWSQQQSALVSRIKYNFATRSLTGPCFSASCCQNCEGESHVNNYEQMWTVFVA